MICFVPVQSWAVKFFGVSTAKEHQNLFSRSGLQPREKGYGQEGLFGKVA